MAETKVSNIGSNQRQVSLPSGVEVLYSYNTPVAAFVPEEGYLRTSKKWSVTTSKHINKWVVAPVKEVDQDVIEFIATDGV